MVGGRALTCRVGIKKAHVPGTKVIRKNNVYTCRSSCGYDI